MKRVLLFFLLIMRLANALAQPANDNPCNAISLTVSSTCTNINGTTVNATNSSGVPAPSCVLTPRADVWYSAVVPASGSLTINTTANTMTDGVMAVYTGTCSALTEIGCNDNGFGMPQIALTGLTPGSTVWIRIWGYASTDVGTFKICATIPPPPPPPPSNDDPCNAITLTPTANCSYTTYTNAGATATAGMPAPGCANYSGGDVWFKVTVPTFGSIKFDSQTGGMLDGGMAIYSGTSCSALTLISCDDDASANGSMPSISASGLVPGSTVWVRFWEYGNDNNGTFGICATYPPPPTVQDCPAAIPICQNVYSQTVSYSGTGNLPNEINGSNSCLAAGERADVWYTFTVQTSGDLNFLITPNNLSEDYDWAVYNLTNANCSDIYSNPAIRVSCNFSSTGGSTGPNGGTTLTSQPATGTPYNATIPVLAGQTYVINVSNYSQSVNGYTINFGASTASIFDNVPPTITSVVPSNGCNASLVTVNLSENILCNTVQTSDFAITGPGGPYTVTGWASATCAAGATYTDNLVLTISPTMSTPGSYQLCLTNASNTLADLCGNLAVPGGVNCLNYTIVAPPTPGFTINNPTQCLAGNSFVFTNTSVYAGGTMTYQWNFGDGSTATTTNATHTYSAMGTYSVLLVVTTNTGCVDSIRQTVNVTTATTPTFNSISSLCSGGVAPVLPNTSINGVTGTWNPAVVSNTATGTYTFTPSAGQCALPLTITVTVIPPPVVYAHSTNPTCANLCNGTATVDVVGGIAPYTYSWSNGGTTRAITGLCVGTYTVTVKDSNNCTSSVTPQPVSGCFQIQSILVDACSATEPEQEMVFFQVGNAPLGTSGLSVTWPNNSWNNLCQNQTFINNTNATITGGGVLIGVPPGGTIPANANVVLITGNTLTVSANSFANLSDTLYVLFQCSGVATGGHFSNTATTIRTLIMNFGAGCRDTVSYLPTSLVSTTGAVGSVDGAYVNFSPNGTPTYLNYGCVIPFTIPTATVTLTAPPPVTPTFNPIAPLCVGATPPVLPSSSTNTTPIPGTWSPATVNTSSAGTTVYTFTPAAGQCANTATLSVTIYAPVTPAFSPVAAICINSSLNALPATSTNGITGSWSPALNNTTTTTYTFTPNAGQCATVTTLTINVNPTYNTTTAASICQGQSYSLPWGGTATTSGTYTYTYTTSKGCDSIVNINLTVNPSYVVNINASTCPTQAYNLPWGGSASAAGIYSHTYSTAKGCDSVVSINLTISTSTVTNLPVVLCQGQVYNFPWGGSSTLSGLYSHTYTSSSGCDSIVNVDLSFNPIYIVNLQASICEGASYDLPWGGSVTTSATYTHVYPTSKGCDSTVNIQLTVHPRYNINLPVSICDGQSYSLPWGGSVNASGTYPHTYLTAFGCDSVVNVIVTVNPNYTSSVSASICQGQSYNLPWGGSVSTANTYTHNYFTTKGCDSILIITLSINPVYNEVIPVTICQGQSYTLPWGGSVNAAGPYSHNFQTNLGCDSIVTVQLTVNAAFTTNLTANICQGQSYTLPWGGSGNTSGNYSHVYTSVLGCDSVVTINLLVQPKYSIDIPARICANSSYTLPWGGTVAVAGTYTNTYFSQFGCDSIVNIVLTIDTLIVPAFNQVAAICSGAALPPLPSTSLNGITGTWSPGINNTATTTYIFTPTAGQCAGATSMTIVIYDNPIVYPHGNNPTCITVCNGSATVDVTGGAAPYSFSWSNGGATQTITGLCAGNYSVVVTDAHGCVSSNFQPFAGCFQIQAILADACGLMSGDEQKEEMLFFQTGPNPLSAASMSVVFPTLATWQGLCTNASYINSINAQIPAGSGGVALPVAPNATLPPNANVVMVTSNVLNSTTINWTGLRDTIYVMFQCQGNTNATMPNNNPQNATDTSLIVSFGPGCKDTARYTPQSLVDYNGAGDGAYVIFSPNGTPTYLNYGCVLPFTIQATQITLTAPTPVTPIFNPVAPLCVGTSVNPLPDSSANTPVIRGSWSPSVINTSAAGSTTYTFTPLAGACALPATLDVVVNPIYTNTINAVICDNQSYTLPWGGNVNTPNTYSYTYQSVKGCDSVVNIILTVNPTYIDNVSVTICDNQSYALPWGGTVTAANTYSHAYQSVKGCDSVVNIILTVNPTYITNVPVTICDNQSYSLPWGGTVTAANSYSHTYQTIKGCDSVVNIILTVNPTYITNVPVTICDNQSYTLPWGGTVNTPNTYSHTYQTVKGCDSVVNIILTVNPTFNIDVPAIICDNQSYTLPWGGTVTAANTYSHTYQSLKGCDSVVNIILTVNPTYIDNVSVAICDNQSYTLPWGGTVTAANTYSHTYQSVKGCDSVVNIILTVNPTYITNVPVTICDNQSYTLPWGGTVNTPNTYSHTYQTVNGCDSVVNIILTVNPTYNIDVPAIICDNQSYTLPWGNTVNTPNTYSHTYQTVKGCDSVVNVILTVNPTYNIDVPAIICDNQSYTLPWGGTVTAANTYSHTYQSVKGCDSVVNIILTVNPTYITDVPVTICDNQNYTLPWGGSVNVSGTYTHMYQSVKGCDSLVNVILTSNPTYTNNVTASVCQNRSYNLPWGGTVNTAGMYTHTYSTAKGCDSVINIILSVKPIYNIDVPISICANQTYTLPWGGVVSTANTYSHNYSSSQFCDSFVNIILTVNPVYSSTIPAFICDNQSYNLPWGGVVTVAGNYSHTYTAAGGCDSIITIALQVRPTYATNTNASICQGQSYNLPWGGAVNVAGAYSHTYSSSLGCDSVVNIALVVNPVYNLSLSASTCQGQSYALPWGGSASAAGPYSHTYTSVKGCDSVVTINLSIDPVYNISLSAAICQGQSYNLPWGGSVNASGTYSNTYNSSRGCDSIVNINLTVNPIYTVNANASTCPGVPYNLPWGGAVLTAGVYSHTYTTADGCDSIINITLSISSTSTTNNSASICQGQTFSLPWGGAVSSSGTYSHTYFTASGCDSIVNINLTVNPVYNVNLNAATCQGVPYNLPWGGLALTGGNYSHTYSTSTACDSVVNIALTVNPVSNTSRNASTCAGVPYNLPWGDTASTAGTYAHTYQSAQGCDSVVNIILSISSISTTNNTASTCAGVPYNLPWGGTATTAGTYSHTYSTGSGCDSLVNITLSVNSLSTTNLSASTCPGAPFNLPWGGTATTAGTYSHTYQSSQGCDSIVNIALTISSTSVTNNTATVCQGTSYTLPWGGTASTAGTYSHTYSTGSGCDSVVNIALMVNPVSNTSRNASTCAGVPYNLPWGGTASVAGTYSHTYQSSGGCDSIVNIVLSISSTLVTNNNAVTCQGVPYNLPWGGTASVGGTYSHTYSSGTGCDSVVNISLSVNAISLGVTSRAICQNLLPYQWNGQSYTATGTYTVTLTGSNGCDSLAILNLSALNSVSTTTQRTICSTQLPYLWNGRYYAAAGIYSIVAAASSGCDSTAYLDLSVLSTSSSVTNKVVCPSQLPYSWNGQSYAVAGVYSVILTNAAGCDSVTRLDLSINTTLSSNTIRAVCPGQLPYQWNGQSYTTPGVYSILLTGSSGCDSVATLTLSVNPATASTTSSSICTSQLPFSWNGQVYSAAGTYNVTLQNAAGCDSLATLVLSVGNIVSTTVFSNICDNQLPYVWNGQSLIGSGSYSFTITGSGGCDSVTTLNLLVSPVLSSVANVTICSDQLPYVWHGLNLISSGTYKDTLLSFAGCDSVTTLNFTVHTVSASVTQRVVCSNQLPFIWNGAAYYASGNYQATLSNSFGCDSVASLALTVNPVRSSNTPVAICSSQLPYVWNGNAYTAAGNYAITLSSSLGCDSVASLQLTVNPTPPPPEAVASVSYCQNSPSVALSAVGSGTLLWYTAATGGVGGLLAPIPSTAVPGTYYYYVSQTFGGCEGPRVPIAVKINVKPELGYPADVWICNGATFDLTSLYGSDGSWTYSNLPISDPTHVDREGKYVIVLTNAFGCSDTNFIDLSIKPPVYANAGPDDSVRFYTPYQLNGTGTGNQFTWIPGIPILNNPFVPNPIAMLTEDTRFILMVKDEYGCKAFDTVLIKVIFDDEFHVPTAFSPNGDGLNDEFSPVPLGGVAYLDYFRVYNRWGELVFETRDIRRRWNGTFRGAKQNIDNYVWELKGRNRLGQEKFLKGNVLLIR